MPQRIEFEGQVHEFPDDFSQEEIAAALSSYTPRAKPQAAPAPQPGQPPAPPIATADGGYTFDAPEPAPEPSTMDKIGRQAKIATQAVGRGVGADLLGAPGDLLTAAVNLIWSLGESGANNIALPAARAVMPDSWEQAVGLPQGDITLPRAGPSVAGSDAIADATGNLVEKATNIDLVEKADMSPWERLMYNTVRVGSGSLAAGAGMARQAMKTPIEEVAKRAPRMSDALLNPYRVDPRKALVTDAVSGAGAGVGMTAGEDLFPDSPVGQFATTMTGAFGGASAATGGRVAIDAARNTARRLTPDKAVPGLEPVSQYASDRAARFVQGSTTGKPDDVAATVKARQDEAARYGEPAPTPGIASGDIGATALERAARLRNPVPFQEADQRLKDAAESNVTGLRDETANLEAPGKEVQRQAGERIGAAQQKVTEAETAKGAVGKARRDEGGAVTAYGPLRDEASEGVDKAVRGTLEKESARKSKLFNEIDPDGTVALDAKPMGDLVKAVRDSVPSTVDPNEVLPNNLLGRWEKIAEGGTVTFKDLNDARGALADAAKNAKMQGKDTLAFNINKMRDYIGEVTDELARTGDEAGGRAAAAVENFKVRFAPRFREGEGGRFAKDVKRDVGKTMRPTDTGRRFLTSKEAAEDFTRIMEVADDPEAGFSAARTWMLNRMTGVVDSAGKIDPTRLRRWQDQNKGVIDQLPGFREEVDDMLRKAVAGEKQETQLAIDLKAAQKELKLTEDDIAKSATGILLDEDPVKAAGRVLGAGGTKGAKQMAEIVEKLGGKESKTEAMRGWKRAVTEHLIDKVTTTNTAVSKGADGPISMAKLQKTFKENEAALAAVYSPQEMQALRRAHKMLEPLGNLSRQAVAGSQTVENEMLWNTVEAGLLGYTGNAIQTGMIMKRVRVALKFLPNTNAQVAHLVDRMWFDPELFQHLMTKKTPEIQTPKWNKRLQQLLAARESASTYNENQEEK